MSWCQEHSVHLAYIQPGKPSQNAFIERFNRTYRHEVLDAHLFESLDDVREITWDWMVQYNEERPHDSLGGKPPSQYRRNLTQEFTTAAPPELKKAPAQAAMENSLTGKSLL